MKKESKIEFYTVGLVEELPIARFNRRFLLDSLSPILIHFISFFALSSSKGGSHWRFWSFPTSCKATGNLPFEDETWIDVLASERANERTNERTSASLPPGESWELAWCLREENTRRIIQTEVVLHLTRDAGDKRERDLHPSRLDFRLRRLVK